jgi:outer membrane receptor protein involved in Fe transport
MRKVKQLFSFFLFAVVLFSFQSISAQTTAAINGTVVDQNGSPLPGANIIAVHQPSGTQYGTTSRTDGKYNLVSLRVGGPYIVTVSFVGYTKQVEEDINLSLSQNLKLDFKLPEQAVQLTGVTVTAEKSAILSQARTGAAQNVSLKQIEEIPTINRSFTGLAKLSPLFSGTSLQAAGRRPGLNNIQVDGTQYNDLFGLGSSGAPGGGTVGPMSLDAIREFQVVIAPYDVRYSMFTGGGINAITRSGTNQYTGSVYFYGRHQGLVGLRNANTGLDQGVSDFQNYQYGARLGGYIIKDKLFWFASYEQTSYTSPVLNTSLQTGFGGNTPDQLISKYINPFADELRKRGMEPGSYDSFSSENPTSKEMIKFDWNISDNHQLSLRTVYNYGTGDNLYNRTSTNAMSFDSYNYRLQNSTFSAVLQLNSHFGNSISNELIFGRTVVKDNRLSTVGRSPMVQVKEISSTYTMTAGFDQYSDANVMNQDMWEVSDNLSYFVGNHTITLGTHNEFFSFENLYIRNFLGYYVYNSLADFQADKPATYLRTYSRQGNPNDRPFAKLSVAQFGFFLQDEWAVLPQLKLTIGLRLDIPTFPNSPARNDSVSKYFPGYATDQIPSGNLLWSPRVGFNWDVSGDRSTQLRGGLGIFTGRIPYVWLSNNFSNSGVLLAEASLVKSGTYLPFVANPDYQYYSGDPRVSAGGIAAGALGTPNVKSEIDLADVNLKMPQLLRFNIGVDQELGLGFIGTAEFLYSKTINDMIYRKMNLTSVIGYTRLPNGGLENGTAGRPIYGGLNNCNNNFTDVLQLYNTSDGYQYQLFFQVQRSVARGLSVNAGYTYGRSVDRNSVYSSQAQSQMRYLPVSGDPNSPSLATSDFEIRNRVFAQATFTWEFFKNAPTSITLFYNGQSGRTFSFVTQGSSTSGSLTPASGAKYYSGGDLNGDNYDLNDLFYIPRNSDEILLGSINSSGQFVPATAQGQTYADLDAFINNNEYLRTHRGQIAERNGANVPWQYYLDMHLSQEIPNLMGLGAFQLYMDISNVLNLLNSDWGQIDQVASGTYSIASYKGRVTYNGWANVPVYSFSKPANNTPYTKSDLASRWQMQLGVRYSF